MIRGIYKDTSSSCFVKTFKTAYKLVQNNIIISCKSVLLFHKSLFHNISFILRWNYKSRSQNYFWKSRAKNWRCWKFRHATPGGVSCKLISLCWAEWENICEMLDLERKLSSVLHPPHSSFLLYRSSPLILHTFQTYAKANKMQTQVKRHFTNVKFVSLYFVDRQRINPSCS